MNGEPITHNKYTPQAPGAYVEQFSRLLQAYEEYFCSIEIERPS